MKATQQVPADTPSDRVRSLPTSPPRASAEERAAATIEPEHDALEVLRSRPDSDGHIRVTAGFELASAATPARIGDRFTDRASRFPGESELAGDLRVALSPFLSEMPVSAALAADYLFTSVGEGGVRVRFRLLVESALLPPVPALTQCLDMHEELGVCLRVLSDWYAFERVCFTSGDRVRSLAPPLRLRAQRRLFAASPTGPLGFGSKRESRKTTQVLLPQPNGIERMGAAPIGAVPLLLTSAGTGTLMASIRAARGLSAEMPVRITLRRRDIVGEELEAMAAISTTISATAHGDQGDDTAPPEVTGIAGAEAQSAIEQLVAQPECLELAVEAAGRGAQAKAWLRILGQELFPGFVSEVVQEAQRNPRPTKRLLIDISQVLAPGSMIPPLLPAPPLLEAISFPRHYSNPTVALSDSGLHLGRAQIGGVVVDVRMPHQDRSLHSYLLGATGTGKSTLLYNMAVQDMQAGHGLAIFDPHGDLYDQLLLAVPSHRKSDLVLVDPDDSRFCPCLNPMDFGGDPDVEVVSRVATDMLEIFERLYDMKVAGGPIFEDYFRHALMLAAVAPSAGPNDPQGSVPTLVSIGHVLRNRAFRKACVERLAMFYGDRAAAEIRQFVDQATATTGETAFENMAMYVSVKLSRFVTNATMRKLFCSGGRDFDFRSLMDGRRILLVNLSKGGLGGPDCRLLGMMLTRYLFNAALSRADVPRPARVPFYFYLDEFQNFVATDIADMLAESRKYGLHLILANQTLGQLSESGNRQMLDAVLGNVATRLFFRVGQKEAASLEAGYAPHFDDQTLANLPDRHVLCRLQVEGKPSLPFVFQTMSPAPLPAGATLERSLGWAVQTKTNAGGPDIN